MKTAPAFHVYLLGSPEQPGLSTVLRELGLEATPLNDQVDVLEPALLLIGPGHEAPPGYSDISFAPPVDAPPSVLRELLRVAMENVVLKRQVAQLDEQATRRHRQFRELNRIGIALSAEKDIERLQSFILTSMRQLTHADGASLWLKTEDENGAKLFLASSQNHSIDKSTYSALTVPMRDYNDKVVGAVQLINAKRRLETRLTAANVDNEVISFHDDDIEMIESIASQAAVALDNKNLIDSIQALFDGFVQASVTALETRDPRA